ncbi:MAG: three-Cys-motif partner protein TcmP [Nanoarchaeota archaeon]
MQKLTGMEWLKKHISKLEFTSSKFKKEIEKIKNIQPEIYNEFQPWTPLKLVLLNYALDTCTTIIRRKEFFKKMYYIDLFAGSGINKIKGSNDFLIGSPLVAVLNYSIDYDLMFFCEDDPDYSSALSARLAYFRKSSLKPIPKDCNLCLNQIMKVVNNQNVYAFFFVDPYFMEFGWDSMKKILNINRNYTIGRDILFTFMSGVIIRFIGLAKKGGSEGAGLTKFFGSESWKNVNSIDEAVKLYKTRILEETPQTVVKTIKVKSDKHGFCYHLFFITNKTKNANPWLKSIDKAKREIEANSDKSVELALDLIKKRQADLSQF